MVAIKSKGGECWQYDVECCPWWQPTWWRYWQPTWWSYSRLDGLVNDVNLMCLHSSSDVMVKGIPVCARPMMKNVCLKAYVGLSRVSSVCTREITFQVVYAYLRSKFIKPGDLTMVLAHNIEHLILSRITISGWVVLALGISYDVVLAHGIDKS